MRRLPACCGHSVAFCSPRFAFACLLTSNLRPSSQNNILRLFLFLFLLRKLLRRLACKSLTTLRSLVYGFALQRLRLLAQLVHFALMPINNILRLFIGIKPPPRRVGCFVPLLPIKKLPARGSFFYWWSERGSNPRHEDFQSSALPTELSDHRFGLLYIIVFLKCLYFFYVIVYFFIFRLSPQRKQKYRHHQNMCILEI